MPAVTAPTQVLVTGASGFLAAHLVSQLLAAGYDVVGTGMTPSRLVVLLHIDLIVTLAPVRSSSKGAYLENLFKDSKGKFSYLVIADIEKDTAFDEAVKGAGAIMHTASPFHMTGQDPSEYIDPAVKGSLNILKSAAAHGSSVKRVVMTSSLAAMFSPMSPLPSPHNYTEADWNEGSPKAVEEQGAAASPVDKYFASKTLAEKAAWKWIEENKAKVSFDLAFVHPSWIFGPIIHEVPALTSLNTSNGYLLGAIANPAEADSPALTQWQGGFVDVRDAAQAHILALEKEQAGGKRFILTSDVFCFADVYEALRAAKVSNAPTVQPSAPVDRSKWDTQDSTQAKTILGLKFRPLGETVVDTFTSLKSRFPELA